MINPLETVEIARRTMTLFFVVDTSSSMAGTKIGAVNTAIREVLPELNSISADNADAGIQMACLAFSNDSSWRIKPSPVASVSWYDLSAGGMTAMGEAFKELNSKLSRSQYLNSPTGCYAPVIFLMSDGCPTDDYKSGLKELQENKWFKYAIRVAVAIGDDADKDVLTEFTGNPELVLTAHTPEALKAMIRFVSVTSSKIGSQSSGIGVGQNQNTNGAVQVKQAQMAQQVQDFAAANSDLDALTDGF